MVTLEINGKVIAAEGSIGVREDADTLHDMLHALTYGDDAAAMAEERYYGMAACALLVDYGASSLALFAGVQS